MHCLIKTLTTTLGNRYDFSDLASFHLKTEIILLTWTWAFLLSFFKRVWTLFSLIDTTMYLLLPGIFVFGALVPRGNGHSVRPGGGYTLYGQRAQCLICTPPGLRDLGRHLYAPDEFHFLLSHLTDSKIPAFLAGINFAREAIHKAESCSQYELLLSSPPFLVTPLSVGVSKEEPSNGDFFQYRNGVWS